jgi:vacuolar-type H+-ATPase subunit F/Vma7
MALAVYLGDEIGATGYRLAGAQVRVPAPGAETAALQQACGRAALVLVAASAAARIDGAVLQRALCALAPLVLVVPDALGTTPLPDLAARLRTQLGLQA